MDIMELGAIGELAGGVAVIATLIYLAAQVRHSIRTTRVASFRSAKEGFTHQNNLLATVPGLAALFIKGSQNFGALEPEEEIRFGAYVSGYFNIFETLYEGSRDGFVTDQWVTEVERSIHAMLGPPGVPDWWRQNPFSFSDSFRSYIDDLLEVVPVQTSPSPVGYERATNTDEDSRR